VQAHDRAGAAFRHPEPVAQCLDGAALAVRGQKFPAEISLSMSMSRAWLATSFFSLAFSASSSLSRLASLAFMPPYWASQRCHVDSADLQVSAHLVEFLAGPEEFVALGELADDLIRRVPPAFVRCHVVVDSSLPEHRATEPHNDWTTMTGSPHSHWSDLLASTPLSCSNA
jgi:hypothetical protein